MNGVFNQNICQQVNILLVEKLSEHYEVVKMMQISHSTRFYDGIWPTSHHWNTRAITHHFTIGLVQDFSHFPQEDEEEVSGETDGKWWRQTSPVRVLEILCFGPELLESFHFYKIPVWPDWPGLS